MRHLLFIGLKCLFTLFLLALPLNGNAQMITTDVVATCNLHSVGVGVTLTGSTYTVSLSNLDNRKVKSVTYWVGDKTGNGTTITPTSAGTYTFPKPATAGTIYVDVIVETNGRLFIAKGGATVTVTGSPVTTGDNTYAQGTEINIKAADVTSTSTSTITTITVVSITGSSADGTLILSPVAKATVAKEVTFTMPASDVTIQVNTETSNTATIETPTGDTPTIKDETVEAPTVTKPATGADTTAVSSTEYTYALETTPITKKEDSTNVVNAIQELAQLKPAGDIILPMEIMLIRKEVSSESSTSPDTITSLTQPVMVILSYPEGVSKTDGIVILHAKRDGKIELIYPTKQTKNFYFNVGSFSPFVLDITKSENTKAFKLNGITHATASLKPNETKQLTPTFSETIPKEDQTIIYKSSNTKVATVDNNGLITAHAAGSATIEAFSLFATAKTTAKCEVTVTSNPVTPDPPVTTQYTLTIPADSRFSSDPAAGTHTYDEGTAVKLTLTLLHADDKGKLTVKANDIVLPAASDGSYVVNMTANKTITFVWDTSVGNEQIQTATATARGIEGGRLEVNRLQPCSVTIVSLSGTCAGLLDTATGITYTHLPAGIYIVAFSTGECIKVQIR